MPRAKPNLVAEFGFVFCFFEPTALAEGFAFLVRVFGFALAVGFFLEP